MKFAVRLLAIVLLLLVLAGVAARAWLQRSLPQLDGEISVRGAQAPVEILRDREGVPHVFAASERDGWFAMGFLHAQDRLWQMEFQRRVAQGRLSEFLGERAFDTDRLMRTLGLAERAERMAAALDAPTRGHLEAYAAGVNAFLETDPVLPVEFQVFGIEPEPWRPAHSIGWLMVMAWDLSSNWRAELGRLRFAGKVGRERAAELIPPYPGDEPWPLPDFGPLYAEIAPLATALLKASPPTEEAIGSNNWAVSGERSQTGQPLLANDPHLGLQAPALWYLAHVATPEGNVVGGTLPGVPFVVLGRNDHLAWSMTTTNSDTQDLFIERLVPGDPDRYLTPEGSAAFEVREEVIDVRGERRRIQVRSTRHGPVISDAVKAIGKASPEGHVVALAWTALGDDVATVRAGFRMNRARSRDEFVQALRDFHAPHMNLVFADREGHIGFVAPALVPVRAPDNESMGRVPVPGWIARYDWQGTLAFEDLPAVHDPESGWIVTANHKITPSGYRPFLSVDWFLPYRAERIEELLLERPKHSLETFARMQADVTSRLARELLPVAKAAFPTREAGRRAQAMLQGWNAEMAAGSAAPLVFTAWYRELTRLVYADELEEHFRDSWDLRAGFMVRVMKGADGYERWCDDVRTPGGETCMELAARAFDLAADDLARRFGEPSQWRWGEAHSAAGDHRPFGFFPVVKRLFNVSPQTPGDTFSVNVGHITIRDEQRPFANRHAPSLRAIYDLADLERSLFMHSTGQSGNVLSPWYASFAERWASVQYITIPTRRDAVATAHRLVLAP